MLGCTNGIDLEVIHHDEIVTLRSSAGSEFVSNKEWVEAVLNFVDSVRDFYRASLPKVPIEDELDKQGWLVFWQEWDERYQQAKTLLISLVHKLQLILFHQN